MSVSLFLFCESVPLFPSFWDPTYVCCHVIFAFLWLASLSMIISRSILALPPFGGGQKHRAGEPPSWSWRIWVHPGSRTRAGSPPQPCSGRKALSGEVLCLPRSLCAEPRQTKCFSQGSSSLSLLVCINAPVDVRPLLSKVPTHSTRQRAVSFLLRMQCTMVCTSNEYAWMELKSHLHASRYLLSSYKEPRISLGDGTWQRRQ